MVTIDTIKQLREKTNAGMMDCKAALIEADGDLEQAETILRKKGTIKAEKKSARATSEGAIAARISDDGKTGVLVEVNCETDFVAKNDNFRGFVEQILDHCVASDAVEDAAALLDQPFSGDSSQTLGEVLKGKIVELGENMALPRVARYDLSGTGAISSYIHMQGKVGVLIEATAGNEATVSNEAFTGLIKDLTLHIAALQPISISRDEVDSELVEKEREIYREQVKGKPENIIDKIVEGKVGKFYSEVCLLEQGFVKDPDKKVGDLVEATAKELGDEITITRFSRFALGETAS